MGRGIRAWFAAASCHDSGRLLDAVGLESNGGLRACRRPTGMLMLWESAGTKSRGPGAIWVALLWLGCLAQATPHSVVDNGREGERGKRS